MFLGYLANVVEYVQSQFEARNRQMRTPVLPFLSTHVANIAQNKQLGLVFLMQRAQETFGLSSVSQESLVSDQLQVGAWMIQRFISPSDGKCRVDAWAEFEPFSLYNTTIENMRHRNVQEITRMMKLVQAIDDERVALGEQLWVDEHAPSAMFLQKVIVQTQECVAYTEKRVDAIKVSLEVDSSSPEAMFESLMTRGTETGMGLLSRFGSSVIGVAGIGPMAYLAIKNMITPPMIFGQHFLDVVRQVVEKKAIEAGYTRLAVEEVGE